MIEINFHPSKRDLKIFAILLIVFFSFVASWLRFKHDMPDAARVVLAVSVVLGIVCFFVPTVSRIVYVGWMIAVFPIGWVVSHVLLAVIYFGVFTSFGMIMRLLGHDPMQRKFDPTATTYWIRRAEQPKPERYFRQY